MDRAESEYITAAARSYYPEMMRYLLENARRVYDEHFARQERYILHGNIYYRNALKSEGGILTINPAGYSDAFVFEFMPMIAGELFTDSAREYISVFRELTAFFGEFTDTGEFGAALFVFLVRQLVPSIYEADDNFRRADKYMDIIRALYLDENNTFCLNKYTLP